MTAPAPTILATSAGYLPHPRLRFGFGPMMALAVELGQEAGPRREGPPRVCSIGTASGDDKGFQRDMEEAAREAGYVLHHLNLCSQPNVEGGVTDSFGPELKPVTDGLGFLPGANGVHMDAEQGRRPLLRRLVGEGVLGPALCSDDGTGLLFRGTELVEAVGEVDGARVTRLERGADGEVVETELPVRRLG